jgi:hypothetical protein
MKSLVTVLCFAVALFFCAVPLIFAAPAGLEKKGEMPSGFTHGEKVGWKDSYPPGWDKKNAIEKETWKEEVDKGRATISKAVKGKGMSTEEAESAADDFEKAARKGLDPVDAESLVKDAVGKGKRGKGLSDSVSEESEKLLKEKNKKSDKSMDRSSENRESKGNNKGNSGSMGHSKGKGK